MIKKRINLQKLQLPILTMVGMLIKTIIFISSMYVFQPIMIPFYLFSIIIMVSPGLLFKGRGQALYMGICSIIFSLILTVDSWYYRISWDFIGLQHFNYSGLFNPFHKNLINFSLMDVVFWIDTIFIIFSINKGKTKNVEQRRIVKGIALFIVAASGVLFYHVYFDLKDGLGGQYKIFQTDWSPRIMMGNMGPLAYHIYEVEKTTEKLGKSINQSDIDEINTWLSDNEENLTDNEYSSILKGKNVIFLQIESMENFIIGQKVYGQEITPNLNKLIGKGYYFNNIFEQNNGGNSIDCDMLVNTSVFPMGNGITFLESPEAQYNSLPYVLNNNGYETVSTHAEGGGDWNWGKAHNNALKFQLKWPITEYEQDEFVGFGLSDKSFLTQFSEKLEKLPKPFYGTISTLSSHGPFDIDDEHRKLDLPKELDENYLGGYFQSMNYTDEQIGLFINKLESSGLMKDTVVVIYGDHGGVHKYYNDKIQNMELEGDWWKEYDKRIPLIIYSEGLKSETFNVYGGHVDIMPTMCYLLGIDEKNYKGSIMGRVLVNTQRNATVIKGGEIKGYPTNDEYELLKKAYDIGTKIIANNYYINEKKMSH